MTNSKGLVHKCNNKHKCALCVNSKPSDSFYSSLTHRIEFITQFALLCWTANNAMFCFFNFMLDSD